MIPLIALTNVSRALGLAQALANPIVPEVCSPEAKKVAEEIVTLLQQVKAELEEAQAISDSIMGGQ